MHGRLDARSLACIPLRLAHSACHLIHSPSYHLIESHTIVLDKGGPTYHHHFLHILLHIILNHNSTLASTPISSITAFNTCTPFVTLSHNDTYHTVSGPQQSDHNITMQNLTRIEGGFAQPLMFATKSCHLHAVLAPAANHMRTRRSTHLWPWSASARQTLDSSAHPSSLIKHLYIPHSGFTPTSATCCLSIRHSRQSLAWSSGHWLCWRCLAMPSHLGVCCLG